MRVILAMLSAAAIGVLTWFLGPAIAQTTFPGPVLTQTTLATIPATVITQNPSRRSIRICNVGTTAIWLWPGSLAPAKSAEKLAPVTSNVTACINPPNGLIGGTGAQWNAQIDGATAGSVSVQEW
jgi:hypothetical protein